MQRRGCISGLGFVFVLIFLLFVGGVTLVQGGPLLASPGPLSAVTPRAQALGGVRNHAEIERECGRCHAPFWSGQRMADRCMECHTNVRDELAAQNGVHGKLPSPRQCKRCHWEHRGRTARLTRLDIGEFPHEVDTVGFTLKEHHKNFDKSLLKCQDCHTNTLASFDQTLCTDCHRQGQPRFTDQHIADVGKDCLSCHDGTGEAGRFDHNTMTFFPLEGKHREIKCKECHQEEKIFSGLDTACYSCHRKDDEHRGKYGTSCESCHTPRSWEKTTFRHDLTTFVFKGRPLDIQTNCYTCHKADDEHNGRFGTQCQACHNTRSWEEEAFDHNETNFPLTGAHANLKCESCHVDGTFAGLETACASCHLKDDAHDGRFGAQCEQCHNTRTWEEAGFDHNKTNFPLTGAHVDLQCESCHVDGRFAGTPAECVACHPEPDVHKGQFGTACAECHTTTAWKPATFRNHTFPLDHGSSTILACDVCHDQGTFKIYTCYNCHEHNPQKIRAEHLEEGITDFQDCVRCHPTGREKEGEEGEFDEED